ncbi:hypothetical protein, partial [Halobellus sp. Atlit-38R]|uniref:hypothetical protein n=1 Tax=Halobellus sp. Atlit-38R TaxID=2282131 RepID=UPI0011C375C8
MDADFTIIPIVENPVVNKGETVRIQLFVSGSGSHSKHKLYINYSYENLLDTSEPKNGSIGFFKMPITTDSGGINISSQELPPNASYFYEPSRFGTATGKMTGETPDGQVPVRVSEATAGGYPPMWVELNISSEATPGDYGIPITFTHYDESTVAVTKETPTFHVNTWAEKHRTKIEL